MLIFISVIVIKYFDLNNKNNARYKAVEYVLDHLQLRTLNKSNVKKKGFLYFPSLN